jgi:hypothetical protein
LDQKVLFSTTPLFDTRPLTLPPIPQIIPIFSKGRSVSHPKSPQSPQSPQNINEITPINASSSHFQQSVPFEPKNNPNNPQNDIPQKYIPLYRPKSPLKLTPESIEMVNLLKHAQIINEKELKNDGVNIVSFQTEQPVSAIKLPQLPPRRTNRLNHAIDITVHNIQSALYTQAYVLATIAQVPLPAFLRKFHEGFLRFKKTHQIENSQFFSQCNLFNSSSTPSSLHPFPVITRKRPQISDELIQWISFVRLCEVRGVISPTSHSFYHSTTTTPSFNASFLASYHHYIPYNGIHGSEPNGVNIIDKDIIFENILVNTREKNQTVGVGQPPQSQQLDKHNDFATYTIQVDINIISLSKLFSCLHHCQEHCNGLMASYIAQQPALNQLFANAVETEA